jgi:hypothetical protein
MHFLNKIGKSEVINWRWLAKFPFNVLCTTANESRQTAKSMPLKTTVGKIYES